MALFRMFGNKEKKNNDNKPKTATVKSQENKESEGMDADSIARVRTLKNEGKYDEVIETVHKYAWFGDGHALYYLADAFERKEKHHVALKYALQAQTRLKGDDLKLLMALSINIQNNIEEEAIHKAWQDCLEGRAEEAFNKVKIYAEKGNVNARYVAAHCAEQMLKFKLALEIAESIKDSLTGDMKQNIDAFIERIYILLSHKSDVLTGMTNEEIFDAGLTCAKGKKYNEAIICFQYLALQDHLISMYYLSLCLMDTGKLEQSLKWITKLQRYKLSEKLKTGVKKIHEHLCISIFNKAYDLDQAGNYKEAFPLYLQVARAGYMEAQFNLFLMYQNGRGVDENMIEGYKWLYAAAEQGQEDGKECFDKTFKTFTLRPAKEHNPVMASFVKEYKSEEYFYMLIWTAQFPFDEYFTMDAADFQFLIERHPNYKDLTLDEIKSESIFYLILLRNIGIIELNSGIVSINPKHIDSYLFVKRIWTIYEKNITGKDSTLCEEWLEFKKISNTF